MISADDLKYFIEVARVGHVTRAAERLGITQPALSHAIKKIEADVQVPLFLRSKRGVQLTAAGEILLHSAQNLLEQWKTVREAVLLNKNSPQGLIRLGCHAAVAQYILPEFLTTMLEQYPLLHFQLVHGLSRQVTDLVNAGQLDVGIAVNPARNPDLIMTPLCEDEVTMWQSKSCRNPDVLFVEPSLMQTQFILNKLKKENIKNYRLIESTSLDVIAKLVIGGAGRGLLPRRVLLSARGEQCEVVKGAPKFVDKVYLIYKKEFRQMMRGKVFIENLKKMRF